jgi:hypothetical protein
MATLLAEVALELAALYPDLSPEKISDIIIRTIESEPMLREIFKAMRLPNKLERKRAEQMAKRAPVKKAREIKQKMERISFYERLKHIMPPPTECSYSVPSIPYDGEVVRETPLPQLSNANLMMQRRVAVRPYIELRQPKSVETLMTNDWHLKFIKEPTLITIKGFVISSSKILEEVGEVVKSGQILSFDDIQRINRLLRLTDDEAVLSEVLSVLDMDLKLRSEKFHVDCIQELYRGEDLLPQNMRAPRPRQGYLKDLIYEKIRAIVLHEYGRLHRLTALEFIDGKIAYDEYVNKTREYAIIASRIYPR